MAISLASLTAASGSSTDASSYTTASITPSANKLVLVHVASRKAASPATEPTLSGCGITWTVEQTVVHSSIASPLDRLTTFRGLSASPSTGALTIDFGGVTQITCAWVIQECTDVDTSQGNQGIVQSVTDRSNGSTSPSVTLAAFSNANNATVGTVQVQSTAVITNETGYTTGGARFQETYSIRNEWLAANDTTPSFSLSVSSAWGMIGLELAAVSGGGGGRSIATPIGLGIFRA